MKIFLANDHAATDEKFELLNFLQKKYPQIEFKDLGTETKDRCNYPEYAKKVVSQIQMNPESRGILICGSGIGMSMVANRYQGIRAALCCTVEQAVLSREHNDANILCLGARTNQMDMLKEMTSAWIETEFGQGRHSDRIALFNNLGEKIV